MANSTFSPDFGIEPRAMAFEVPKSLVTWDVRAPLYMGAQTVVAAALICGTPKGSFLRLACLPLLVYLMLLSWRAAPAFTGQAVLYSFWWVGPYANIFHCANNLILHPLDDGDIRREMSKWQKTEPSKPTFIQRVIFATSTLWSFRGINTDHQVQSVPQHVGSIVPSRARFLVRQCILIAIQYCIMDLLTSSAPSAEVVNSWAYGKEYLWLPFNPHPVTVSDVTNRLIGCTMNWYIVGRAMNDIWYRVFSVIFVGSGLTEAKQWPPLYGDYRDTYTLRRYFGSFWHQVLRWPFQGVASYLSDQCLSIPRGPMRRYFNIFVVFFLSGSLHSILEVAFGGQWNPVAPVLCFCLFPLGIMFEDGVQKLWRQILGRSSRAPTWFDRAFGHLWVITFLAAVTPIFNYPLQRIEGNPTYLVPWSLVQTIKKLM